MKTMLSAIAVLGVAITSSGCGSGGGGASDPAYMKSQADLGKDVKAMFTRSGGEFDKLTPQEREEYVKSFGGDEKAAKEYWTKMKTGTPMDSRPAMPK